MREGRGEGGGREKRLQGCLRGLKVIDEVLTITHLLSVLPSLPSPPLSPSFETDHCHFPPFGGSKQRKGGFLFRSPPPPPSSLSSLMNTQLDNSSVCVNGLQYLCTSSVEIVGEYA